MTIRTKASTRNLLCLDALSFFVADVQTGFGPFIAVYLATSGWSEGEIGGALSVGAITAMISQIPGGAVVDRLSDKRIAAGAAGVVVGIAALLFAVSASRASVWSAQGLHSFGSAMLGPAVAAVSLAVVGRARLGERLGRNARFAAIGNGGAAALLGVAGTYLSSRAVFWLTGLFMLPGLAALGLMRFSRPMPAATQRDSSLAIPQSLRNDLATLFTDRRILGFVVCIALFHLANAAQFPLISAALARRLGQTTDLVVAAGVVVPQAIVAVLSPWVGRAADRHGPRLILALGFAAVPIRAVLLSVSTDPYVIVAIQALDGISAASFGVLVPLTASELTRGTNRFNLCLGVFGLATAGGATISTSLAGRVADTFSQSAAFLMLGLFGIAAVAAAWLSASPRGEHSPGVT